MLPPYPRFTFSLVYLPTRNNHDTVHFSSFFSYLIVSSCLLFLSIYIFTIQQKFPYLSNTHLLPPLIKKRSLCYLSHGIYHTSQLTFPLTTSSHPFLYLIQILPFQISSHLFICSFMKYTSLFLHVFDYQRSLIEAVLLFLVLCIS